MKQKTSKKKKGQEFINTKTNSDKEFWDDIDSKEDDEWAKKMSLTNHMKKEQQK